MELVVAAAGARVPGDQPRDKQPAGIGAEEALRRFGRIVVLGDAGMGKTTMLNRLAVRLAGAEVILPIYVELREYAGGGAPSVAEFASGDGGERAERLAAGRVALLFDGLDEVLAGASVENAQEAYRRVVDGIGRVAARYPAAMIAVTCRRAGWRDGLGGFQVLEVADLDWPRIAEYARGRLGNEPARAKAFLSTLRTTASLPALASNPLVLSLLVEEPVGGLRAPGRRAEFYHRVAVALGKATPAADRKFGLLAEVAWHLHRSGARECGREDLLSIVAGFLATTGVETSPSDAVVEEIAVQEGLLTPYAEGRCGFAYLALQEYFTAVAAVARGMPAVAHLVRHRHDPWWQEVLLLFASQTEDASPLLLGILGRDPRSARLRGLRRRLAVDDDILHQDLLLAARCLAATSRIRVPWLRPAIVKAVHDLMRTCPSHAIRATAAQALVAAGDRPLYDRLIDGLADTSKARMPRARLVEALGATGDGHVAARLTGLLDTLELNDDLAGSVAVALQDLWYTPAVPALRARLDRQCGTGLCDGSVAGAVAALGGAAGAAHLHRLLETVQTFRGNVTWALKFSAEPAVGEWLIESVSSGVDNELYTSVVSYLDLHGAAGAARLLAALLSRSSWGFHFDFVESKFHPYTSPALATPLLEALTDRDRVPEIRWAVSAILDHLPETWPTLHTLMNGAKADRLTVHASAAVLGRQGHQTALRPLRAALTTLITDLGNAARRFALPRVAEALAALGDDKWVQETLLPHIEDALVRGKQYRELGTTPMLVALARTDVQRIPDRVGHIVDRLLETEWYVFAEEPELAALVLPSAVSHLLDLVESGRLGRSETAATLRLVETAARDLSAIHRLLPLLSEPRDDIREATRDALAAIGRQHRVRIFADGRTAPVGAA